MGAARIGAARGGLEEDECIAVAVASQLVPQLRLDVGDFARDSPSAPGEQNLADFQGSKRAWEARASAMPVKPWKSQCLLRTARA